MDGDLITAGPQSPVQFARATLGRLGLGTPEILDAYEGVFHRADRVGASIGAAELREALATIRRIAATLDAEQAAQGSRGRLAAGSFAADRCR